MLSTDIPSRKRYTSESSETRVSPTRYAPFVGSSLPFIEQEVIASDAAQNHSFEPIQIVGTVTGGFRRSGDDGLARIAANDPRQLAQGNSEITVSPFSERGRRPVLERSEESTVLPDAGWCV